MWLPLFFPGVCGHAHVAFIEFSHLRIQKGKLEKIFSPWTLHWLFVQPIGGLGVACLHILCLLCWKLGRFTIGALVLCLIHNAFKATLAQKGRITSIPLNFPSTLKCRPGFVLLFFVKYWWTTFDLHYKKKFQFSKLGDFFSSFLIRICCLNTNNKVGNLIRRI